MFVATDKNGGEFIYSMRPSRGHQLWVHAGTHISVPKGTIQRLLNYPLTWDDDCQEIVEYKNNTTLNDDKVIKQNIKIRVTPEQSKKVQEICFENGICWIVGRNIIQCENKKYLYLSDEYITFGDTYEYFEEHDAKEIDADLFIRTNGTCEDTTLNDGDVARILKAFEDQPIEYLRQNIINLHDQLNKYRKNIQNQKEELTRLLNQKEELQYKLNGVTNLVELSIQNDDLWAKQLEEKDGIIKYLESKLYN